MKLGSMISGGKDSLYAMYLAKKEHDIVCIMNMKSDNESSYMFHTPNSHLVELQAESMNVPLLKHKTQGNKEEELKDLKDMLKKAKDQYKIEGITTGALFSDYQRKRIENICNELELKCISPLWHMDQLKLLHELIDNKFEIIISSIAADGFSEKWLGRKLDSLAIEELVKINKKVGINLAFEGGEAESLVVNCPLFKKKIIIKKAKTIMQDEITGQYKIIEAVLE